MSEWRVRVLTQQLRDQIAIRADMRETLNIRAADEAIGRTMFELWGLLRLV